MTKTLPALLLLVATALTGCASAGERESGSAHVIPVRIENDLTNRSDASIHMIAVRGASTLLGGVRPGGSSLLEYREQNPSGLYYLRARTGDGRVIESRQFTLFPDAGVVWYLKRNDLRVVAADLIFDPPV